MLWGEFFKWSLYESQNLVSLVTSTYAGYPIYMSPPLNLMFIHLYDICVDAYACRR